jgi:hypothetical protein
MDNDSIFRSTQKRRDDTMMALDGDQRFQMTKGLNKGPTSSFAPLIPLYAKNKSPSEMELINKYGTKRVTYQKIQREERTPQGVTSSTFLHCITNMDCYFDMTLEELRYIDYKIKKPSEESKINNSNNNFTTIPQMHEPPPLYTSVKMSINYYRISQDHILDEYKKVTEELLCDLCKFIPINPVQCNTCNRIFCKDCIFHLSYDNCFCRSGSTIDFWDEDKSKLLGIIKKIKFKCPNQCKNNSYSNSESVEYKNIENHLTNQCDKALYKCMSEECDYMNIKSQMEIHLKKCPQFKINCDLCATEFMRKDKESHLFICLENLSPCRVCKKKMCPKDLSLHEKHECLRNVNENCSNTFERLSKIVKELEAKVNIIINPTQ